MSDPRLLDLTYQGRPLGQSPDDFGRLRRSDDARDDRDELWHRMEEDGYIYLPGLLDPADALAARRAVMDRLADAGFLDAKYPPVEGVPAPVDERKPPPFMPNIAKNNGPLLKAIYQGPMMDFYRFFLGGPVRHYDYTWFRVKAPGTNGATTPHYDVVYMGRGTKDLFTSWTPFGDVPLEMGGLILLENSHKLEALKQSYGATDVDRFCANKGDAETIVAQAKAEKRELTHDERNQIQWNSTGAYSGDAIAARAELGGRWLAADYKLGDVLIFCMYMMHASADNRTDRVRISSDSRYQLAGEAIDQRWIGDDPPAHGIRAKEGMVC